MLPTDTQTDRVGVSRGKPRVEWMPSTEGQRRPANTKTFHGWGGRRTADASRGLEPVKECAMRSIYARGVTLAVALSILPSTAWCQDALPSLFPLPLLPSVAPAYP